MKIEKNFRKDFDNRIKQLCEDFCDQADERKFFNFWEHVELHHGVIWNMFVRTDKRVLFLTGLKIVYILTFELPTFTKIALQRTLVTVHNP